MATALITGVSGFCGRHLVKRLREEKDIQVVGTDLHAKPSTELLLDKYLALDIRSYDEVCKVLEASRPDFIFHLAGVIGKAELLNFHTNFVGGVNLLEAVKKATPRAHTLIVGSAAEYGSVPSEQMPITEDQVCRPSGAYALSKYALTLVALDYAKRHGLHIVVARPFNIIGPGIPPTLLVGALLGRLKTALKNKDEAVVDVGNLETERDFIAVEDAVDAYVRLVRSDNSGEVFNICSGTPYKIRSVVEEILSLAPRPISPRKNSQFERPDDVPTVYGSGSKAFRAVRFKPQTSISKSLRAAWNYEMEGIV